MLYLPSVQTIKHCVAACTRQSVEMRSIYICTALGNTDLFRPGKQANTEYTNADGLLLQRPWAPPLPATRKSGHNKMFQWPVTAILWLSKVLDMIGCGWISEAPGSNISSKSQVRSTRFYPDKFPRGCSIVYRNCRAVNQTVSEASAVQLFVSQPGKCH